MHWDEPDDLHVIVQVGRPQSDNPDWQTRSLEFHRSDAPEERWKTVGLTIATLADGMFPPENPGVTIAETQRAGVPQTVRKGASDLDEKPAPAATSAASAERTMAKTTRANASARELWFGVAARGGPGLHPGGLRFGAQGSAAFRPTSAPWFAGIELGFAARPTDGQGLYAEWETASLAAGAILGSPPFFVEPQIGFGWQFVRVVATNPTERGSDAGGRGTVNLSAGTDFVIRAGDLGFLAGATAWRATSSIEIIVENHRVATDDAAGFSGLLGLRYYVP